MRKIIIYIIFNLLHISIAFPTVLYVKGDASGANDGSSWTNAFTSLESALALAVYGDTIWVAAGIYKPSAEYDGTGSKYRAFRMKSGIVLMGGFKGNEPATFNPEKRNFTENKTILSGDHNNNDVYKYTNGYFSGFTGSTGYDNSLHIISNKTASCDSTAMLDGFTIKGGNALAGTYYEDRGGGILMKDDAHFQIRNCLFIYNVAYNDGAAIFNTNGRFGITNCQFDSNYAMGKSIVFNYNNDKGHITTCSFRKNYCQGSTLRLEQSDSFVVEKSEFTNNNSYFSEGGAISVLRPGNIIRSCSFINNYSAYYGGALYTLNADSLAIINCLFSNNEAVSGGALYNNSTGIRIINSTFASNKALMFGNAWSSSYTTTVINSILWNNTWSETSPSVSYSRYVGGTGTNTGADPLFIYPIITSGNIPDDEYANWGLSTNSPCINRGKADTTGLLLPITDIGSYQRIVKDTVDMGAYEFNTCNFSALISGDTAIRPFETANIAVGFTGNAPWTFRYTLDNLVQAVICTRENPYIIESKNGGKYTIDIAEKEPFDSLLLYMPFETNNVECLKDLSGKGHNATASTALWYPDTSHNQRGAMVFEGNEHIYLGNFDLPSDQSVTFSAWFLGWDFVTYPQGRIISKATTTTDSDHLWMMSTLDGYKLRFRLRAGGSTTEWESNANIIKDSIWYHFVGSYDGSYIRLYLNGELIDSIAKTGVINKNPAVGVAIGNQPAGAGSRPWYGLIDDIKIYGTTLSGKDILTLYNEGCSGSTHGAAYVQMLSCVNTGISVQGDSIFSPDTGTITLFNTEKNIVYEIIPNDSYYRIDTVIIGTGANITLPVITDSSVNFMIHAFYGDNYEAENNTLQNSVNIKYNAPGYSGTAYTDLNLGSYLEWNNINGYDGDSMYIIPRYTNGDIVNRTCQLSLNDSIIDTLYFTPTGSWNKWGSFYYRIKPLAGNNTLLFTSLDDGPDLDRMIVVRDLECNKTLVTKPSVIVKKVPTTNPNIITDTVCSGYLSTVTLDSSDYGVVYEIKNSSHITLGRQNGNGMPLFFPVQSTGVDSFYFTAWYNDKTIYEAEDYTLKNGNSIINWTNQYTGTGALQLGASSGNWAEWKHLNGQGGGTRTLVFNYWSNTPALTVDLAINGVYDKTITFPNTSSIWDTLHVTVSLQKNNNTLRLTTTNNQNIYLDYIQVNNDEAGPAYYSILNNKAYPIIKTTPSNTLSVSDDSICGSGNGTIDIQNTQSGISYNLFNDYCDSLIAGPLAGNGSTLSFTLSGIKSTTLYHAVANSYNSFDTDTSVYIPELASLSDAAVFGNMRCNYTDTGYIELSASNTWAQIKNIKGSGFGEHELHLRYQNQDAESDTQVLHLYVNDYLQDSVLIPFTAASGCDWYFLTHPLFLKPGFNKVRFLVPTHAKGQAGIDKIIVVNKTPTLSCAVRLQDTAHIYFGQQPDIQIKMPVKACSGASVDLEETGGDATNWYWTGPNSFVSTLKKPTLNSLSSLNQGLYNVRIANAAGCTNNASENLLVLTNANGAVVSKNDSICSGDSSLFTVNFSGDKPFSFTIAKNNVPFQTITTSNNLYQAYLKDSGTYEVNNISSDITQGLVFNLEFDNNATDALKDLSGNNNNAINSNATWVNEGGYNLSDAFYFNKINSNISIPDHPSLDLTNQLTITAWIKPSGMGNYDRIATKSHTSDAAPYTMYGLMFDYASGGSVLRFELSESNIQHYFEGKRTVPLNTWTFAAVTFNGDTVRLFYNDTIDLDTAFSATIDINTQNFTIGQQGFDVSVFDGYIDNVRLYNRALSKNEMSALFKRGISCQVNASGNHRVILNNNTSAPLLTDKNTCDTAILHAGTGNTLYQWYNNKGAIPGATKEQYIAQLNDTLFVIVGNTSGCLDTSNTVKVHIDSYQAAPVLANATACDSLSMNADTGHASIQWYNSTSAISGANSQFYQATQSESYFVVVTGANNCSDTSNKATITIYATPAASTVVTGDTTCKGDSASALIYSSQLNVNYQLKDDATGDDYSLPITGNGNNLPFKIQADTTRVFKILAYQSSCSTQLTNKITIKILASPDTTLNVLGDTICPGEKARIYIENSAYGHLYALLESNITDSNLAAGNGSKIYFVVWPDSSSTYPVSVTNIQSGCSSILNKRGNVMVAPLPNANLPLTSVEDCEEETASYVFSNPDNNTRYTLWNDTAGYVLATLDAGELTSLRFTDVPVEENREVIWLEAISAFNCKTTDTVLLRDCFRDTRLQIANVLTPDNNGENDYWVLRNIEYYPEATIKVFDRWGRIVFVAEGGYDNSSVAWDGSDTRGNLLPTDSYHFIIDLKDGSKPLYGNVTIIR